MYFYGFAWLTELNKTSVHLHTSLLRLDKYDICMLRTLQRLSILVYGVFAEKWFNERANGPSCMYGDKSSICPNDVWSINKTLLLSYVNYKNIFIRFRYRSSTGHKLYDILKQRRFQAEGSL